MEIKGKTAIITGASGKLAEAIVPALAGSGAKCICVYNKNEKQAEKLKTVLNGLKIDSLFIQADLGIPENIENIFARIGKFAIPQILVNTAAVFEKKAIEDITFEYIRQTIDINFAASIMMIRNFVKLVRQEAKTGLKPIAKIVNITDIVSQKPPARFSIYSASKSALITATKSLAKELAPDFTVNAVSPGIINWHQSLADEQKKKIIEKIPTRKTGQPKDIACAVKFLVENDCITGQVINVDGGKSL
ncbi:MAG: SDR family oxidoreductase [Sedimentisphaerales bacterium]|nr:SDR family oxidoreductase [Sedimentisphaerales bacterium]